MDTPARWHQLAEFLKNELPDEAASGRLEAEIWGMTAPLRIGAFGLVDQIQLYDTTIDNNVNQIKVDRDAICRVWNRSSQQEQDAARTRYDGLWDTVVRDMQAVLVVMDGMKTNLANAGLVYSVQALQNALTRYRNDQQYLDGVRADEPELQQAYGNKIKARDDQIPALDQATYQLCQQQVLLPHCTLRSNFRASPISKPGSADLAPFGDSTIAGASWRYRDIGVGGQGTACLYDFVDNAGTIINRIVIKDSLNQNIADFSDFRLWHGDTTTSPAAGNCVPMEAHTLCLMNEVSGSESTNTVRLLAAPQVFTDPNQPGYRLHMEYAPHGDVGKLLKLHAANREPVPVMFLWLVFRALLRNALIMEQGGIATKRNPWNEIVYSDFKSENLFLGARDSDYYPHYPTPKLGDFGLAFPTNDQDPGNPDMYALRGTPGHYASEQIHWIDSVAEESMNDDKLLSPCNVYGLATIIYELMERNPIRSSDQPPYLPDSSFPMFNFTPLTLALYSHPEGGNDYALPSLISQCLNANPDKRPKIDQLLYIVNMQLDSSANREERVNGRMEYEDDTLLVPGEGTKLKWASRLEAGIEGLDWDRVERESSGSGSSSEDEMDDEDEDDDDDDDEEMEDASE